MMKPMLSFGRQLFNPSLGRLVAFAALFSALAGLSAAAANADVVVFKDDFRSKMGEGWSWVRENRNGWRVTDQGLEVRLEPGNMWGPQNNARNVLVRNAPDPAKGEVDVSVQIENRPTEQYEQVDLVWYYSDSNMIKLGQELVDGKLSIVMGREEGDKARTIAIIPTDLLQLEVRFLVHGNQLKGQYRAVGAASWKDAGECDLPVQGAPKISIQCYQGPERVERWAKITNFVVKQNKN